MAIATLFVAGHTGLEAQRVPQQRVLALYASTPAAPGAAEFNSTFQDTFRSALGSPVDLESEYIELSRFSEPGYIAALVNFLRYKYGALPPDVVIGTTRLSRLFAEQHRSELFPGAQLVFSDRSATHREPGSAGVIASVDLARTVDLALTLQPETQRVFVVSGVSTVDRSYLDIARRQLVRFEGRVQVTYWADQSMAALERAVSTLPPRSVIFFLTLGEDGAGARFVSVEAGERLAAVANAPIYSWNMVMMGRGVVGGHLLSNTIISAATADLAVRILRGEPADSLPIVTVDPHLTQLDWRQLRRWNIDESRLPPGATVLFREPGIWDRYEVYIAGAFAMVLLQSLLITRLLVQSRRRRRAETDMKENQQMLEQSNRQVSELFGRLLSAQETERGRIARDLHDDISQRIAALSITMSGVKRKLVGRADQSDVASYVNTMQREAAELAAEIRQVSHDLHPSALQHAGLVVALSEFCSQFGKLHQLSIAFSSPPDLGQVDAEAALCLYRVAQEALQNVARHAGAAKSFVSLTREDDVLQLSIVDHGKGFTLADRRRAVGGLGLLSIDERVRVLGGQVEIETRPGGGTRVQVRLQQSAVAV